MTTQEKLRQAQDRAAKKRVAKKRAQAQHRGKLEEARKRVAEKRTQAQAARPADKPTLPRTLSSRPPLAWRPNAPPIGPPWAPQRLLLTMDDLRDLVRMSRAQIYKVMAEGRFPRPVAPSLQKRCWIYDEVLAWRDERVAERDGEAA
jgi:prophage regulatory protein